MKTINVRELRTAMPRLRELLAAEQELVLVSNGQAIARLLPPSADPSRPRLPSLKAFRATMPKMEVGSEVLIRAERDRR